MGVKLQFNLENTSLSLSTRTHDNTYIKKWKVKLVFCADECMHLISLGQISGT